MFKNLSNGLSKIISNLKGKNLDFVMDEIKIALIDADVPIEVTEKLLSKICDKAKNAQKVKSFSFDDVVKKIIYEEIVDILSHDNISEINDNVHKAESILLIGLQGSGKTTQAAKLANYLKGKTKKVLLVSLDTNRPAAYEQLKILAESIQVHFFIKAEGDTPQQIAKKAKKEASAYDVVIYDTAGRMHLNEELIAEASAIKNITKPDQTLLVIDSMMGQESLNVAEAFDIKLKLDGAIITRVDGDAKGGVMLGFSYVLKKPINFIGVGEKIEDLQLFKPESIASRILDMGDIESLAKNIENAVDQNESDKINNRIKKGKFNFNDYFTLIKTIDKMGGIANIAKYIPGGGGILDKMQQSILRDEDVTKQIALIQSMTKMERVKPLIINASRKKRIASGSGNHVRDVEFLIKQYTKMHSLIKKYMKLMKNQA